MAIDDVISNYDTAISDGNTLSIQPASGDEWLITSVGVEGTSGWDFQVNGNTAVYQSGYWGGETGTSNGVHNFSLCPIHFFVTNTEYLILKNGSGSTDNAGYSAIKTKD